jgi:hypothetical protein
MEDNAMTETIKDLLNDSMTYVWFYVLMFINTYGHAFVTISSNPQANDLGMLIGALVSASFWPLYWSVKFWS